MMIITYLGHIKQHIKVHPGMKSLQDVRLTDFQSGVCNSEACLIVNLNTLGSRTLPKKLSLIFGCPL